MSVLLVVCLAPTVGRAMAPDSRFHELARGGLQRSAAALDDGLDVVRLALVDLLPALQQVLASGRAPGAQVTTPIGDPAVAVFAGVRKGLTHRVSRDALPPLARVYHADALAALERLAEARTIGEVLAPAQALLQSWQKLAAYGDALLQVLDKPHPTEVAVYSTDEALDAVGDALQQLALSEANLKAIRSRAGPQGEQLAGFARLEIDLGNVLDLIYASEASGLHIGLELAHASGGMARRLASVHKRLASLQELCDRMAARPPPVGSDLHAELCAGAAAQKHAATLRWTPHAGAQGICLLRVSRWVPPAAAKAAVQAALRCDGQDSARAQTLAATAAASLPADFALVGELPPGRASFEETWAELPLADPVYRLVAVSPFGVVSKAVERRATILYSSLQPPGPIAAQPRQPALRSDAFYRDAEAVDVRWEASPSDIVMPEAARFQAVDKGLPLVSRYDIFRLVGEQVVHVSHVPAGVHAFVDRPPPSDLAVGVRYAVEARAPMGPAARAGNACAQSPPVVYDARRALRLARAGGAFVEEPSAFERSVSEQLRDPAKLAAAHATFARRDDAHKAVLLQGFWRGASEARRIKWYRHNWKMLDDDERSDLYAHIAQRLCARDRPWVQAELFLNDNKSLADEPERHWSLLGETAQQAAWTQFYARLGGTAHTFALARRSQADANARLVLDRPVHVAAWWTSRDDEELARQRDAWDATPYASRNARIAAFIKSQARPVAQAMLWPDWEALSDTERKAWLDDGFERMPRGLWPSFLAWVQWQEMETAPKVRAIAQEVGVVRHLFSYARYSLRVLDVWLDFKLLFLAALLPLGAISGLLLQAASRRQG